MMFRFVLSLLLMFSLSKSVVAMDYNGNHILEILGEDKNSDAFKKFKTQFLLDKSFKNTGLGIKLTASHDTNTIITAITLTSAGCELNDTKFKQFSEALPFDISFNDDAAVLEQKLGSGKGGDDDGKLKFKKDGITINVFFKTTARKKITYIKFTQNIGLVGPYRLDGKHEVPVITETQPAPDATKNATPVTTKNTTPVAPKAVNKIPMDPFYKSIMAVIESGEEDMFKDIKKEATAKNNFWNYKYTYATSVAIPGEKYNMLYSFPFQSSQLDFVSVLEETDAANPVIEAKYKEVEEKLKEFFKPAEGWSYNYTINQEDPKGIKDLELKNPKLGSIVLDHSINPKGRHVLYLRFLLQYT